MHAIEWLHEKQTQKESVKYLSYIIIIFIILLYIYIYVYIYPKRKGRLDHDLITVSKFIKKIIEESGHDLPGWTL